MAMKYLWAAIKTFFMGPVPSWEIDAAFVVASRNKPEVSDWRNSVVDLLKILKMKDSFKDRAFLAMELGLKKEYRGFPAQNIWLHGKILEMIAKRVIPLP
jgi:hypothetical protein